MVRLAAAEANPSALAAAPDACGRRRSMDEVRALALTGALGSGYLTSTLETALAWDPDFIGVDAGSTDSGPASLGTGECSFSRAAVKRDIKFALLSTRQKRIPLLVGSAGTAGGDLNPVWMVEIVELYHVDTAQAIKASIPCPTFQGELYDTDSHGGQAFGPLVNLEIP